MYVHWGGVELGFGKSITEVNHLGFDTKNLCHDEQHTDCGKLH